MQLTWPCTSSLPSPYPSELQVEGFLNQTLGSPAYHYAAMSELLLITKPEHDLFPTLSLHGSLITEVSPPCNRPSVSVHTNSCSTLNAAHQVNKWLSPSIQMDNLYKDFWLRPLALGPWGVIKWWWSLHTATYTPCRWQMMTAKQTNKWAHCSKISTRECTSAQTADHFLSYWSAGAQKGNKQTCGLLFWCFQDLQASRGQDVP